MTCEHLHKDEADLASLVGRILLEMQKSSFILKLCLLVEVLGCVFNLSKYLQKNDLQLSVLPKLITSVTSNINFISENLKKTRQETNDFRGNYEEFLIKLSMKSEDKNICNYLLSSLICLY